MSMLSLDTPIGELYMVGDVMAQRLKKLNIYKVEDLLRHYPARYEDFRISTKIASVQPGEIVTITGKVISIKNIYTKYGKKIQQAFVSDETGSIEVMWYNQPFLINAIKAGQIINLAGKIDFFRNKLSMQSPVFETPKSIDPLSTKNQVLRTIHTGRLVPIYPETYGVSSKWLRSRIAPILRELNLDNIEFLPDSIFKKNNFMDEKDAINQIHFPDNLNMANDARHRLSFDELFLINLSSKIKKRAWQKETVGLPLKISPYKDKLQQFTKSLPFDLTTAQRRSIGEILTDLGQKAPMNRLLEGEVGSGKTVVATVAMFITYLNSLNSILMAPTEILAQQHYETVNNLLKPYKIKTLLVTRNSKIDKKLKKKEQYHIYIGTHALLSEKLTINNLGLAIIDEQQRFGVEQRAKLKDKGINPHLLTMTATPIPRTMALALFGELDLSLIDELPQNRQKVKTWVVPPEKREGAYAWIDKEIAKNNSQAFIICPFIEESETLLSVKAVKKEFAHLEKIFTNRSLGLLHGKMKDADKKKILEKFQKNEIDILVSTPIVEVGIDIPNATIMMIEGADRFGLTQLHQLRGRVGRGEKESYCLLFSDLQSEKIIKRLKLLETNFIGANIAELDLQLRGPGELYGTKQHGIPDLKIAKLGDHDTVALASFEVDRLLKYQPGALESNLLRKALEKYTIKKITNN